MALLKQSIVRNQLLSQLSWDDFANFAPHLTHIRIPLRTTIHYPDEPIKAVFFPEHGYASMLAILEDGDAAEVGMIGREGMVGIPIIMGTDRSTVEAIVQAEFTAFRLEADTLRRLLDDLPSFRALMLRYAMAFNVQVTMTAACNGRHSVERRLARWLLMALDRVDGDEFAMTHEFLSTMLAVRRAGVSVAAASLQKADLIRYDQGRIRVVNREGLENAACECHRIVRREFARLLGPAVNRPSL